jgi:hypothetical protein
MVQRLSYTCSAGVVKSVKSGASPLEINDIRKTVLVADPIGASVIRTKGKVTNIAGVTRPILTKTFSKAYRN